jgi:hypothetical protein
LRFHAIVCNFTSCNFSDESRPSERWLPSQLALSPGALCRQPLKTSPIDADRQHDRCRTHQIDVEQISSNHTYIRYRRHDRSRTNLIDIDLIWSISNRSDLCRTNRIESDRSQTNLIESDRSQTNLFESGQRSDFTASAKTFREMAGHEKKTVSTAAKKQRFKVCTVCKARTQQLNKLTHARVTQEPKKWRSWEWRKTPQCDSFLLRLICHLPSDCSLESAKATSGARPQFSTETFSRQAKTVFAF